MKKTLALFLALMLILSSAFTLTSCTRIQHLDFYPTDDGYYASVGKAIYLSDITVPASYLLRFVVGIPERGFADCINLKSILLSSNIATVGADAFYGCDALVDVNYAGTVAEWCAISFANEAANPLHGGAKLYIDKSIVSELVIPEDVTLIKEYSFNGCASIENLVVSEGCKVVSHYAFQNCENLASVELPDSVETIGYYAFRGCVNLTSIEIPSAVKSIGGYAFSGCEGLTSVIIGSGVERIGYDAFSGCTALTDVYFTGSEEQWAQISGNTLPAGVILHCDYEVETPEVETPEVETPEVETPEVETPEVETPEVETPEVETPEVETPEIETPEVETPEIETPEVETPES